MTPLTYPPTPQRDVIDDFFGVQVSDPYRWLEDTQSEDTQAWGADQNRLTAQFLGAVPDREKIQSRLTALWDFPKYSVPYKRGPYFFFTKNDGIQDQPVLYKQEGLVGTPEILLNPNLLSEDGTVALITQSYSKDGAYLAYGLSTHGSDWQEIRVLRTDTGEDLVDLIEWTKFAGIAWKADNSGFFYNRLPKPGTVPPGDENLHSRVYWHQLGTSQTEDVLIFERPEAKELGFYPEITDDSQYLTLFVYHGTDPKNGFYYQKLDRDSSFIRLIEPGKALFSPLGNEGSLFYFHTDLDAPNGRVVAIDLDNPNLTSWQEIVPEMEDAIAFVTMVADRFVIAYTHHATHQLRISNLDGSFESDISLPEKGSIIEHAGQQRDTHLFLAFTSFLHPTTIYAYEFVGQTLLPFHKVETKFDPTNYETKQVFYPSKDGTQVPMFLTHKKGLALDGTNQTILYGYGGFNINQMPSFSVAKLLWLEQGGVFALANLRGGNEYGETWHQAGMLERKQNVFDDFIAAAEWLVEHNYTSREKLAIEGRSNGGLLVAASMVQRPDMFGAVLCHVPVIDMLRYHKFTVGSFWVPEYGNAEAREDHFRFLHAYSPLHNIREGVSYPPTLITSADTDDRVVPAHAKKFAATLQAKAHSTNPILIRVETKAGHGLGKPISKLIAEQTDIYAFLFKVMGIQMKDA